MQDSSLANFVEQVASGDRFRVESDLGHGYVRLRVSEAERRQAKQDIRCVEDAVIEMLRNSRDANGRMIFLAVSKSGSQRRVVVLDNGSGIPADMRELVFEPRVTSKLDSMLTDEWGVHGRGMALYSIKENATEAYVCDSAPGKGSAISVRFDTIDLPERADQSTLPSLVKTASDDWRIGPGPHNIAKAAAEFALSNRDVCTVYMGSPIEVAATLLAFGQQFRSRVSESEKLDIAQIAPVKRLAYAEDAASFASLAEGLGLDMSSRSAYRIMQGEVEPLSPLLDTLKREREGASNRRKGVDLTKDFRGLKVSEEDRNEFAKAMNEAYALLAERYYLEPDIEPEIRFSGEEIRIVFPVHRQ